MFWVSDSRKQGHSEWAIRFLFKNKPWFSQNNVSAFMDTHCACGGGWPAPMLSLGICFCPRLGLSASHRAEASAFWGKLLSDSPAPPPPPPPRLHSLLCPRVQFSGDKLLRAWSRGGCLAEHTFPSARQLHVCDPRKLYPTVITSPMLWVCRWSALLLSSIPHWWILVRYLWFQVPTVSWEAGEVYMCLVFGLYLCTVKEKVHKQFRSAD